MKSASTRRIFYRFAWCWSRVVVFNKNKMKKKSKSSFHLESVCLFVPHLLQIQKLPFKKHVSIDQDSSKPCLPQIWLKKLSKSGVFYCFQALKLCFYYNLCKKIFCAQFLSKTLFQNEKLRLYIEVPNILFVTN